MKTCSGFVFLSTLISITIISLLILTGMQHILLYHKAFNALNQEHERFYQLENVALQISQGSAFKLDANCIEHSDAANRIMKRLMHHDACPLKIGSANYLYLIEEMNDFPCLIIWQKSIKYSTHHRRISVLVQSTDTLPDALIQLRQINPINYLGCTQAEQTVKPGISSWRYLAIASTNTKR